MAVHAEGSNVSDVLNQLHSNDRSVYLSIKPIDGDMREFYRDVPYAVHDFMPTERFLVQWNGSRERFTKEVVGVKALFDLLRPIFNSHARCKRERDAFFAKKDREVLLARQREIQAKIDTCKKTLAGLEKDLAALG